MYTEMHHRTPASLSSWLSTGPTTPLSLSRCRRRTFRGYIEAWVHGAHALVMAADAGDGGGDGAERQVHRQQKEGDTIAVAGVKKEVLPPGAGRIERLDRLRHPRMLL